MPSRVVAAPGRKQAKQSEAGGQEHSH
jgi:hypothetical protein